jgi:hypothetical protein
MSTPRIPPVPPNKGGELDKTAPSSQHRKVEKIEKISKVSEVDDESRARQFRQFVEAPDEEEPNLPTPFALPSLTLPPPKDPTLSEAAETALPSPGTSPTPSTYLEGTAAITENEEASPLPQSQQFWGNVEESSDQPPMQPQMEEAPRSSSRVFLSKEEEETGRKGKMPSSAQGEEGALTLEGKTPPKEGKKGGFPEERGSTKKTPSPFGPPGKPTIDLHEDFSLSRKKEGPFYVEKKIAELDTQGLIEPKKGEEPRFLSREEKKKRFAGAEGVIAPKGEEGIKYIGPLAAALPGRAESSGELPPEDRLGSQLGRALKEEEEQKPFKRAPEIREKGKMLEKEHATPGQFIQREEEWGEPSKKKSEKEKRKSGDDADRISDHDSFARLLSSFGQCGCSGCQTLSWT